MSYAGLWFLIGTGIGFGLGYAFAIYLFRRERKAMSADWLDLAHSHQTLSERLKKDDTRLGINTGISFATDKMSEVVDELRGHIEDRE